MFERILRPIKLRSKCSTCDARGNRIDQYHFECPNGHGVWDGAADFVEQLNYAKMKGVEIRDIG